MKYKVSIVQCENYSPDKVDYSIQKALDLIEFKFQNNQVVLIKPNILGAFDPEEAITTHPSIVEALCKILKKHKSKIIIADSSFTNTEFCLKKTGMEAIAKKYNAKLVNFDKVEIIKVDGCGLLKTLYLPKIIQEVDMIINIPKLKTHGLTKFTGAVKNLYGTIPGNRKRLLHKKFNTEYDFSKMLVDLSQVIKPGLNIMDAVYGIEGDGPTTGKKKKTGLILASENAIALDIVSCDIICYKEKEVLTNFIAKKQGLINHIEIMGNKEKIKYKKPKTSRFFFKFINFVNRTSSSRINLYQDKCIRCGICSANCPTRAIILNPYPKIDHKKCISCFCCIEGCPKQALSVKDAIMPLMNKASYWVRKFK